MFFTVIIFLSISGFIASGSCQNKVIVGSVKVSDETLFVAQSGGNTGGITINPKNNSIRIDHGPRCYLAEKCVESFDPYMYKRFPLLDASLSFDVDLSDVECACNAAVYLSSMPGRNSKGEFDPTSCGDYYCDANKVCGEWCPEMDLMEANKNALQVTPHSCHPPDEKQHYDKCDKIGCGRNTYRMNHKSYGPGSEYIIDTNHPFNLNFTFKTSNNVLSSITTIITGYNGKTFRISHTDKDCGRGYLEKLTDSFRDGMVLIASNWGDSAMKMLWLDIPPCSVIKKCSNGAFIVSDIKYQTMNEE